METNKPDKRFVLSDVEIEKGTNPNIEYRFTSEDLKKFDNEFKYIGTIDEGIWEYNFNDIIFQVSVGMGGLLNVRYITKNEFIREISIKGITTIDELISRVKSEIISKNK